MNNPRNQAFLFAALSAAALALCALPGTADVNVWRAWSEGLAEAGFLSGYNAGAGHILHPPLGMLLLHAAHEIAPILGLPAHVWPEYGWTGFKLAVWVVLVGGGLVVWRISGAGRWALAFLVAYLLNSVVYGAFDLFGIPFLILAIHAFSQRRTAWALAWYSLAALIKFQFLIFAPFIALYAIRSAVASDSPVLGRWRDYLPAALIWAVVLVFAGHGTLLALERGIAHDTLSGYALNSGWILTWAMHVRWPESYGPLQDGLIEVLRTRDTRVMALVRFSFGAAFLFALWRQWRGPQTMDGLLRAMLAGYLAYFLFNKGVHENHLAPAVAVAGYLAWRDRGWLWDAVVVAVAFNLNMFFFYAIGGSDRGNARVVAGFDLSLPLALLYVLALGCIYARLLGVGRTHWSPGGARGYDDAATTPGSRT